MLPGKLRSQPRVRRIFLLSRDLGMGTMPAHSGTPSNFLAGVRRRSGREATVDGGHRAAILDRSDSPDRGGGMQQLIRISDALNRLVRGIGWLAA